MASIIIPATKSLTITDKLPNKNINSHILPVGNDGTYNYLSYLYFNLSSVPCNVAISHAELVLFKVNKFYNDYRKTSGIYPLIENFNQYTSYNNPPGMDYIVNQCFYPIIKSPFIKISITSFVVLWLKNKFTNASIMLYGKKQNSLACFGSAICTNKHLIPFLKISFVPCGNKHATLRQIQVTGTVAAESIYNAVVNIQVSRHSSNRIDNYYVVDVYNNLLNNTPLHVNKTYNIAIIPSENIGDTETTTLYGSYQGAL